MSEEVRVTNEKTGGQKGTKLQRMDLVPVGPLFELSELYGHGAKKYAARNWERGYDWSLSIAALLRHALAFWGGEDLIPQTPEGEDDDPTAGCKHMAAVAWHAFALMQFMDAHPELDDRPSHTDVEYTDEPEVVDFVPEPRFTAKLDRQTILEGFESGIWKKPVMTMKNAQAAPRASTDMVQEFHDRDEETYERVKARKKQEKKAAKKAARLLAAEEENASVNEDV